MVQESGELFLLLLLCSLSHTAQPVGHDSPALCRARVELFGVFLSPASFPPQPPPSMSAHCSAESPVLRRGPTPLKRACLHYSVAPSQAGLDPLPFQALQRSPGSRACCFSACEGSWTTQDRSATRDYRDWSCCLPLLGKSRHPGRSSFRSSITPITLHWPIAHPCLRQAHLCPPAHNSYSGSCTLSGPAPP